ncbi:MAG: patatin [Proteobacteria bacterium]|nr:patatin [Pseudomonadota bacterium]
MKHILSIDGGGIRGLIPAMVLTEIEKQIGRQIAKTFDLIAGTSTGGILALGLCKDNGQGKPSFSSEKLASLYRERGNEIFSRSLWKGLSSVGGITDEKYSHQGIEKILEEYFEDDQLETSLTKVLITSYDIENRKPVFFKSWKDEWKSVKMRHAARATSAAPTFFEPALVQAGNTRKALIDGGVFVNNPAVTAYAEAKRIFPEETNFLVVSLGTGELTRPIAYDEAKDWGLAGWMLPVLSCMFDGVSDATDYQLKQILGNGFFRFQTTLTIASDDMDNATKGNIENLKVQAQELIEKQKTEIEKVCNILKQID